MEKLITEMPAKIGAGAITRRSSGYGGIAEVVCKGEVIAVRAKRLGSVLYERLSGFLADMIASRNPTRQMTIEQINMTSAMIIEDFGYLTNEEIMYFAREVKKGKYLEVSNGRSFDVRDIREALIRFLNDRADAIDRIDRERQEQLRLAHDSEIVPCPEYIKKRFNLM